MESSKIVGFWKFRTSRIRTESGDWIEDKILGGTMAFSANQEVVFFARTDQGTWGYSGRYEFDGASIRITIEVSTVDDIEGSTLYRNIAFLNNDELLFSGAETHTDRLFEVHFVRV